MAQLNYKYDIPLEAKYTYSEWKQMESIRQAKEKTNRSYYIKQKLAGLTLAAIGLIIPFINGGDATASLFLLPLGIYITVTKEKMMMF